MAKKAAKWASPVISYGRGLNVAPGQTVTLPNGQIVPLDDQNWVDSGQWAAVISTRMTAISYDKPNLLLFIEFPPPKNKPTQSTICEYTNVPEFVAKDLFNASSKGQFLHQRIDGVFTYRVV